MIKKVRSVKNCMLFGCYRLQTFILQCSLLIVAFVKIANIRIVSTYHSACTLYLFLQYCTRTCLAILIDYMSLALLYSILNACDGLSCFNQALHGLWITLHIFRFLSCSNVSLITFIIPHSLLRVDLFFSYHA